jgi:DNA (cytosine-5)-methyltransferase 1
MYVWTVSGRDARLSEKSPRMVCLMEREAFLELLDAAVEILPVSKIATHLKTGERNVRRWVRRVCLPREIAVRTAQLEQLRPPFLGAPPEGSFRFIDLFAGIGGLRQAFESVGGECVFTSEWDEYAQRTYKANFPSHDEIHGDITAIAAKDVPKHDVLVAGFPCQPFSIAGVSKKNALGRTHGFLDETQGTLFFDVARIIAAKRPRAFLLENVKNLVSHDKGRTFAVIRGVLSQKLGYQIHTRVLDGMHFVPQHRERIVIVGFREPADFSFDDMKLPEKGSIRLRSILHREDGSEEPVLGDEDRFIDRETGKVNPKYTLTPKLWSYLQGYAEKHRAAGNGFGFGLVGPDDVARTLSARYYKDGSEILVRRDGHETPRRLTPRECARLMGFPDTFKIPVSDTRAYKQFGNSVVVPVFEQVSLLMKRCLVGEVREDSGEPLINDCLEQGGAACLPMPMLTKKPRRITTLS